MLDLSRYFDHAASSPLVEPARAALAACDEAPWAGANPNALHTPGRLAFEALEGARRSLSQSLGARRPAEVVLTSGGTESNVLAVEGAVRALHRAQPARRRILVSAVEHDSVLDPARRVAGELGMVCETVPVTCEGVVDLAALEAMLGPDVALVSVMAVNNEVGTVQPVARVAELSHAVGALVHTDAVQAFGHVPCNVVELGVDLASVAAHKIGGPLGVGVLYVRARTPLTALTVGGGQEGGLRSGTQDVRGACAFAAAARDAVEHLDERAELLRADAAFIVDGLCRGENPVARPTVDAPRDARFAPGIVHLVVPGHQSEGLLLALDVLGYAAASGSACSSGSLDPSHVLSAMGISRDEAFCALRLSFDHRSGREACAGLVAAVREACAAGGRRRR